MQKSDIKNGMHVITNNGEEYVILSDIYASSQTIHRTAHTIMANINGKGWMNFDKYTYDLRCENGDFDYEIQSVFEPKYYSATLKSVRSVYSDCYFTKLWERPTVKKMTKTEIEKELGYEIEIID